jgi:hypothetical protein
VTRRRTLVAIAAVVLLALASSVVAYRYAYGTFAWWTAPERISWCGRTYLPASGPPSTRSAAQDRLVEVARVPPLVGSRLLAPVAPAAARPGSSPCSTVVYLEVGTDSYATYVLSGGP